MVSFCKLNKKLGIVGVVILIIGLYVLKGKSVQSNCSEGVGIKTKEKVSTDGIKKKSKTSPYVKNKDIDESKSVWASGDEKIEATTILTTVSIDSLNNELEKTSEIVPLAYVGFTKIQLAKYYDYYMMNKPTEELEKGLLSIDIISFSKDEIMIKKLYDKSNVTYFVTEDDGLVKVYYADKVTLYENTGISVAELPDIEQKSIKFGMMVKDKDELIAILESYSS